jgi:general secretion pathway protein A
MYEAFYGLRCKPFALQPQGDILYPSKQQRIARCLLDYALQGGAPFTVVSGETGTGKTTLVRDLMGKLGNDIEVGIVAGAVPACFTDLLQWMLSAFDINAPDARSIPLQRAFLDFLAATARSGKRSLLIIDEAQHVNAAMLEELRMLANVNIDERCLLQVLLVGQPALRETLRRPELRQMAQRVAVDYTLMPFEFPETQAYIMHRLIQSGARGKCLFDTSACAEVYELSGGIPRLINLICDLALVYGYAEGRKAIDAELVRELASDKIRQGGWLFAPAAQAPASNLTRIG